MQRKKLLFLGVLIANLAGAVYGFTSYYGPALLDAAFNAPHLLVFIPDCPFYALLFAVAITLTYFGKNSHWFNFLVYASAMKYGFWTVFVLAAFPDFYFTPSATFMYSVLFVAHIGLFFQPKLFFPKIEFKTWFVPLILAWLFLNDFADYFLGTNPPLPQEQLGFMFLATVAMTLVFTALAFLLARKYPKPLITIFQQ